MHMAIGHTKYVHVYMHSNTHKHIIHIHNYVNGLDLNVIYSYTVLNYSTAHLEVY